jgi:hypothetical protein
VAAGDQRNVDVGNAMVMVGAAFIGIVTKYWYCRLLPRQAKQRSSFLVRQSLY